MALPAIEPAVEPTAEPMTLDQKPPPLEEVVFWCSRQENLFHFLRITKNPLAYTCGFVSFGHAEAPMREPTENRTANCSCHTTLFGYFTPPSPKIQQFGRSD